MLDRKLEKSNEEPITPSSSSQYSGLSFPSDPVSLSPQPSFNLDFNMPKTPFFLGSNVSSYAFGFGSGPFTLLPDLRGLIDLNAIQNHFHQSFNSNSNSASLSQQNTVPSDGLAPMDTSDATNQNQSLHTPEPPVLNPNSNETLDTAANSDLAKRPKRTIRLTEKGKLHSHELTNGQVPMDISTTTNKSQSLPLTIKNEERSRFAKVRPRVNGQFVRISKPSDKPVSIKISDTANQSNTRKKPSNKTKSQSVNDRSGNPADSKQTSNNSSSFFAQSPKIRNVKPVYTYEERQEKIRLFKEKKAEGRTMYYIAATDPVKSNRAKKRPRIGGRFVSKEVAEEMRKDTSSLKKM